MARERESFRDQLQSLQAKFPEQEVLTKDEACKLLGLDWDALVHNDGFPAKKALHHPHCTIGTVDGYMVARKGGKDNGQEMPESVPKGKAEYRNEPRTCSGAAWTVAGKPETV